jgi:hypothetical protein
MTAEKMVTDQHRVGRGYAVSFTASGNSIEAKWFPDLPPTKVFNAIMRGGRYHAARNQFLQELLAGLGGGPVVCADVEAAS